MQTASPDSGSYGQILKSSALIGGAQVVNVAVGIARTKAMALLLGPAGFGLAGLYSSIIDLSTSVAASGCLSASASAAGVRISKWSPSNSAARLITWPDALPRQILATSRRVYQLTGYEHEWRLSPQGHVTGRSPLELALYVTSCSKCCYFHGLWCATGT